MMKTTRLLVVLTALLSIGSTACERSEGVTGPEARFSNGQGGTAKRITRQSANGGTAAGLATHGNGVQLEVAGHTLTVPVGAVRSSTIFSMSLAPEAYFGVDLTATRVGGRRTNDVGARGFAVPVRLCFDLSDANLDGVDVSRLSVAEMVGDRFLKVATSLDGNRLCGELRHFSGYTMIED